MRVKTVVDEDFTNYKKASMFVGTISCGGKCCTEAGLPLSVCQNDGWRSCAPIVISDRELCQRYLHNPVTSAIVFGGLEPMEQFGELCKFLFMLRNVFGCSDDVVIYTGYNREEIASQVERLKEYKNIIIKFGRYRPNEDSHLDETLGIRLASGNQYAEKIS